MNKEFSPKARFINPDDDKDLDYCKRWFDGLWDNNADEYEFFQLAKHMMPGIPFYYFDKGWQFTTILHENENYAWQEFLRAIYGMY